MVYLLVGLSIGFIVGYWLGWRKGSYNERIEMVRTALRIKKAS